MTMKAPRLPDRDKRYYSLRGVLRCPTTTRRISLGRNIIKSDSNLAILAGIATTKIHLVLKFCSVICPNHSQSLLE